jgi:hypothetical protein
MGNLPDKSICQTYNLRDQHGWDFLVCEGIPGWSATHVITPFGLMMLTNNFLLSYLIAGFVEIFETLALLLFHSYLIFNTPDADIETKAGSLIGDWLLNDLFGVFAAYVLLSLLSAPGLLDAWIHRGKTLPWQYKVKLFFSAAVVLGVSELTTIVIPANCRELVDQPCINLGLILFVTAQSLAILVFWTYLFRRPDDYKYLWKPNGMSDRRINFYFGFWIALIVLVGLQNMQPFIPLIDALKPMAEFAQVWLAVLLWFLVVIPVLWFTFWRRV